MEKHGYNFCTREGSDVANHRVTFTKTFTLTSLTDNVAVTWQDSRKTRSGRLLARGKGQYQEAPRSRSRSCGTLSNAHTIVYYLFPPLLRLASPGVPRISSTSLALVSSELILTINGGAELNPDAREAPVLQITGVETLCIASSDAVTSSKTTPRCASSLGMQVQVQTTCGVSRLATVAFPTCSPACSVNGILPRRRGPAHPRGGHASRRPIPRCA